MGTLVKNTNLDTAGILQYCFPVGIIPTWTVIATTATTETIEVYQYSNAVLEQALVDYLAGMVQQEAEQATSMAEERAALGVNPSLISVSGRQYLRINTWYTGADDQYGYTYYQNAEWSGSGTLPIIEWEHLGIFLPAGRRIERIHIVGRTNSTTVTDINMHMIAKKPNPSSRWETGYDNDNEVANDVILSDNFFYPTTQGAAFSGNMADTHRRTFDLGYDVTEDCLFGMYMRPVTTNTSTRYFYHTWTLEVS